MMRYIRPLMTLGLLLLAQAATAESTPPLGSSSLVESDSPAPTDISIDAADCGDEVNLGDLTEAYDATGNWSVLTELTILFPSYSTSTLETASEHPILGPRVSLGWVSARGFGIRGRGWGFDSAVDAEAGAPAAPSQTFWVTTTSQIVAHQIEFSGSRFDLDFFKRVKHQTGDVAIGASITAAHLTLRERYQAVTQTVETFPDYYYYNYLSGYGYELESPSRRPDSLVPIGRMYYPEHSNAPTYQNVISEFSTYSDGVLTTTYQGGQLVRNRGAGLGLLAEGTHRFYETPYHIWSVFGRGRIAYLIGRWDEPYSNTLTEGDGNMAIGEAALGLEYRRPFRYAELAIQCAFEVQSWDVSIAERINLAGVTTGVGLSW